MGSKLELGSWDSHKTVPLFYDVMQKMGRVIQIFEEASGGTNEKCQESTSEINKPMAEFAEHEMATSGLQFLRLSAGLSDQTNAYVSPTFKHV